jgi:predicted Fe-S protein YdhL (DUF1289 family)
MTVCKFEFVAETATSNVWRCPVCTREFRNVTPVRRACRMPGPGWHLKQLLAELGITPKHNCGCEDKAAQMDVWGVAGCVRHREEIIGWLNEAAAKQNWLTLLQAAWKSGRLTVAGLVDEAIRRANTQ